MATIGTKLLSAPASYLLTSKNTKEQVAVNTTAALIPSGGWLTHFGAYVRWVTEAPEMSLAAWLPDSSGLPGILLARTDPIAIPDSFQGNIEAPIVWTNPIITGGLPSALRVDSGLGLIFGWVISGGDAEVGLVQTTDVSVWRNNNITALPVNPFGSPIDTLTMDPPAVYATHVDSTKPTATLSSPAAAASLTNDKPTLVILVTDIDTIPYGDGVGAYDIQLRLQGSPTLLYNQHTITAAAPLFGSISHLYDGPDLVGGNTYEWAVRVQDMAGEWSDWTAWRTFSISNVGIVDVSSGAAPAANAKVDGDSSLIDWTARFWHTLALAGDQVQVRVLNQSLAVANLGAIVNKAITGTDDPPGTLFTVQDTEAGIGALSPGQQYYWQIRVRASNGVFSDWSQAVPFRTNAIPSIPIPVSPVNGFGSTDRPRLVVASTDPDADDVPLTDVVWEFEIFDQLGNVSRFINATDYDATLGRPSVVPTSVEIPHEGVYLWRARGKDLSAGSFGISQWSAFQSLTFGAGPVVTVDNPLSGETQLTSTPRIDWHTDDTQTAYAINLWEVVNNVRGPLAYTKGKTLSPDTFWDIPAGGLTSPNGKLYELVVSSWDEGDLKGDSAPIRFLIQYGAIEGLADVTISMIPLAGDVESSTPSINWTATKFPLQMGLNGQFVEYLVKRWDVVKGRVASEVLLARVSNISQLSLLDYHAPPNTPLAYAVSQRIRQPSLAIVESGESLVFTTVFLQTPTLVSVKDPLGLRFPFMYLGKDFAFGGNRRRGIYRTWGVGGIPTAAGAPGMQRTRSVTFTIRGDQYASLKARRQAIVDTIKAAGPFCLRDEYEQIFMDIVDWSGRRGNIGQLVISLSLEEVAFREGAI